MLFIVAFQVLTNKVRKRIEEENIVIPLCNYSMSNYGISRKHMKKAVINATTSISFSIYRLWRSNFQYKG